MPNFRFIATPALDTYSNMAIDEALLCSYLTNRNAPVFRLYSWQRPSISFGYFQDPLKELDVEECLKAGVPFVRRITGGSIIFHHNELTYSIVCSKSDIPQLESVAGSFRKICSFLISFYNRLGLDAGFAMRYKKADSDNSSFCFASRQKYDIIINSKKIGGNAQKRCKDIIFQHGSIPLSFDAGYINTFLRHKLGGNITDDVCSLGDFLNKRLDFDRASFLLKESLKDAFQAQVDDSSISDYEEGIFKRLLNKKYRNDDWNFSKKAAVA